MQLANDGRAGSAELAMVAATSTMLQRKKSTMDFIFRPEEEEEGHTHNEVPLKPTPSTMVQIAACLV